MLKCFDDTKWFSPSNWSTLSQADTINVPSYFPTLQGVLNVACNGDVIMISEGTYFDSNINPNVKTFTIAGEINDLGKPLVNTILST